jgi:hypothetical protein
VSLPAPEHTAAQHRQHGQQLAVARLTWKVNNIFRSLGEMRARRKPSIKSFFALEAAIVSIFDFSSASQDRPY